MDIIQAWQVGGLGLITSFAALFVASFTYLKIVDTRKELAMAITRIAVLENEEKRNKDEIKELRDNTGQHRDDITSMKATNEAIMASLQEIKEMLQRKEDKK